MDNNFNNILKEFRTKHKLTQPEMSVILGISLRMYQLYESNSFTGSENKKSKYIAKLTSWEIKKDESNKHEISFVNEPNENYGTKFIPVFRQYVSAGRIHKLFVIEAGHQDDQSLTFFVFINQLK